jgi:hypothetical protein
MLVEIKYAPSHDRKRTTNLASLSTPSPDYIDPMTVIFQCWPEWSPSPINSAWVSLYVSICKLLPVAPLSNAYVPSPHAMIDHIWPESPDAGARCGVGVEPVVTSRRISVPRNSVLTK